MTAKDLSVPTPTASPWFSAGRVVGLALGLHALLGIAPLALGLEPSSAPLWVALAVDLSLALALLVQDPLREITKRLALVRAAFGLLFALLIELRSVRAGVVISLLFLLGFVTLLLETKRETVLRVARGSVALSLVLQLAVVLALARGFDVLNLLRESPHFEPWTATVRGQTLRYQLRVLDGWRALKNTGARSLLDDDRHVAHLAHNHHLRVRGRALSWEQSADVAHELNEAVRERREQLQGFVQINRGTLVSHPHSPFVEYEASVGDNDPRRERRILTVVRNGEGELLTLETSRPALSPSTLYPQSLAMLQGISFSPALPVVQSERSRRDYLAVPPSGLHGRRGPYTLSAPEGWFAARDSRIGEGIDQRLLVPFEDVGVTVVVFRVTPAIDILGTLRQRISRIAPHSESTVRVLALPEHPIGAMARYTYQTEGVAREGLAMLVIHDNQGIFVIASTPRASSERFYPQIERMFRSMSRG
ncbi:MAG: hypothetical protein Q8Q09_04660 [Deltaproteobacteria bacterium]|nr:hypothetical protein [Deltaproteobacteria bacterium]